MPQRAVHSATPEDCTEGCQPGAEAVATTRSPMTKTPAQETSAVDVAHFALAAALFPFGERGVVQRAVGRGELDDVEEVFGGGGPLVGVNDMAARGVDGGEVAEVGGSASRKSGGRGGERGGHFASRRAAMAMLRGQTHSL